MGVYMYSGAEAAAGWTGACKEAAVRCVCVDTGEGCAVAGSWLQLAAAANAFLATGQAHTLDVAPHGIRDLITKIQRVIKVDEDVLKRPLSS
jgi:hypothetical protein